MLRAPTRPAYPPAEHGGDARRSLLLTDAAGHSSLVCNNPIPSRAHVQAGRSHRTSGAAKGRQTRCDKLVTARPFGQRISVSSKGMVLPARWTPSAQFQVTVERIASAYLSLFLLSYISQTLAMRSAVITSKLWAREQRPWCGASPNANQSHRNEWSGSAGNAAHTRDGKRAAQK